MLDATILHLLERCAAQHPDGTAIRARGRVGLDYSALLTVVHRTAAALERLDCGRHDRVAVAMDHAPEMATACLALACTTTCVPLNPAYTEAELIQLMQRLGVSRLISTSDQGAANRAARTLGLPLINLVVPVGGPAGAFMLEVDAVEAARDRVRPAPPGPLRPASDDLALVLHTSGSTALPKVVPLTHRNLLTSAANVVRSLGLSRSDVCLSSLPLFHIGGLVDLLLAPLTVGGTVVVSGGMTANDFFDGLLEMRPTWYQGVPTMLQDILRRAEHDRRATLGSSLRFVRSVSAPLPPTVLHEFESRFGVPVIEIYGMTETAGVITSNPLPRGQRRVGSVGISAGPEVTIVDTAGNPAPTGRVGEILVRGPNVTSGYEQPLCGPADGFVEGWFRTGDEGHLDADGYLYITGRINDIINRGGQKVAPREIDEIVLDHPRVRDAAAFAIPHPTLGEEVALAVVPRHGSSLNASELIAFCAKRLAPFKVPRTVHISESLPRAAGGKLQRSKLASFYNHEAETGSRSPVGAAPSPTNQRQRVLVEMWGQVLGVPGVGVRDNFFDLGGDSLQAAELLRRMRAELGVAVPGAALFDHPTVATLEPRIGPFHVLGREPGDARTEEEAMLAEVRSFQAAWPGTRPNPDSLLIGWNTLGEKPPLFWGAQGQRELSGFADRLGGDRPVYGMRSLYAAKHKTPENIAALARHYAEEIRRVRPTGPIHLGGFCAGAGIAFQVARELRAADRDVASLCLLEHFTGEPYGGRIAYFFNVDSGYHPFNTSRASWLTLHSGRVSLHPTRARHDDVWCDERVVAVIRRELAETERPGSDSHSPSIEHPAAPLVESDRRITVEAEAPRFLSAQTSRLVEVEVRNPGGLPWPEGTTVFSRWVRPGSRRDLFDASAVIERALPPSGAVRTFLNLTAPVSPGIWRLGFDLVAGGDWNAARATGPRKRLVLVLPGAAAWAHIRRRLPGADAWSLLFRRLTGGNA